MQIFFICAKILDYHPFFSQRKSLKNVVLTYIFSLITFHSIVRESFTELVDHNEGNANWVVSPT